MAYVDKELIVKLKHACIAKYPLSYIDGIFALAKEIAEMPEADVVEVVRCEKCKFFKRCTQDECAGYCTHPAGPAGRICKSDFCSYGERVIHNEKR